MAKIKSGISIDRKNIVAYFIFVSGVSVAGLMSSSTIYYQRQITN